MAYRAVIFDLFGTLVHFDVTVPRVKVAGTERRTTMGWLRERLASELPAASFEAFLSIMGTVMEEIVRGRPPEYLEVLSEERFSRVLERLTGAPADPLPVARRLSAAHMEYLASRTYLPPENRALLQSLRDKVKTGLVSNFDHGPTAHAILRRDGIADLFDATLVSADFGRRKPHPAIFEEALRRLGVAAGESLYVGDTFADDVEGALAAGMDVAWLDAEGSGPPERRARPTYRFADLSSLPGLLE